MSERGSRKAEGIPVAMVEEKTRSASDEYFDAISCEMDRKRSFISQLKMAFMKDFTSSARGCARARRKDTPRFRAARVTISFDYFFPRSFVRLEPSRIRSPMSLDYRKMKNLNALPPDRGRACAN